MERPENIFIYGADVLTKGFRNFRGEPDRNGRLRHKFNIAIRADTSEKEAKIQKWIAQGWNWKLLRNDNPNEPNRYHIQVEISYLYGDPLVKQIKSDGTELLYNESMIANLDSAIFENVDIGFSPYYYDVNGKTGWSAYVYEMTFTLRDRVTGPIDSFRN